jgi:hypothetical protein
MSRFALLLILLASSSLVACTSGRRGSSGGGDDDDSAGDDDDDAADDDDDATNGGDDDDSISTTHWGQVNGSLLLNDNSQPCEGDIELELHGEGLTDGWMECTSDSGWMCRVVWSDGYAFSEASPDKVSFDCEGPDSGGSADGDMYIWGNKSTISGSVSIEAGVFDYASMSFNASIPN